MLTSPRNACVHNLGARTPQTGHESLFLRLTDEITPQVKYSENDQVKVLILKMLKKKWAAMRQEDYVTGKWGGSYFPVKSRLALRRGIYGVLDQLAGGCEVELGFELLAVVFDGFDAQI